jgi:hypothetical protein
MFFNCFKEIFSSKNVIIVRVLKWNLGILGKYFRSLEIRKTLSEIETIFLSSQKRVVIKYRWFCEFLYQGIYLHYKLLN